MPAKPISRRTFLKAAGITLGASAVVCSGIGYAASQLAGDAPAAPALSTDTPDLTFGNEDPMNEKILVAYATRSGSTTGVAEAVAKALAGRGFSVDMRPMNENPDPAGYRAVVLGSAVNGGAWLPEAVEYVTTRQAALQPLPAALFCVHGLNTGDDERSIRNRLAYLDPIRKLLSPVDEGFFAGVVRMEDTSPILRFAARLFKVCEGDCRDWAKIDAWGQAVFSH